MRKKLLSILVLLCLTACGAWAQSPQVETLLATINSSENTDDFTTRTFEGAVNLRIVGVYNAGSNYGWFCSGESLDTEDPKEGNITIYPETGYTLTKVEFTLLNPAEGFSNPITVYPGVDGKIVFILKEEQTFYNNTLCGEVGPTQFKVYGYVPHTVTLADGTADAEKWEITPAVATTTGVQSGETVTLKYVGNNVPGITAKVTAAVASEGNITVYFTDAQDYGNVHIHYWGNSNGGTTWPGEPMTWVGYNEYTQSVYKAEIPADVLGIIFNGNDKQTVDILNDIDDCTLWYTIEEEDNSKNKVGSISTYTPAVTVTATENANEWTLTMPYDNVKVDVEYYTASWIGKSAIQVNGTWYYAGESLGDWCTGGAFDNNLGYLTELVLGGQSQAYDDSKNWNNKSITMTMNYKIDNGADQSVSMNWFKYQNNNNFFQTGGENWAP